MARVKTCKIKETPDKLVCDYRGRDYLNCELDDIGELLHNINDLLEPYGVEVIHGEAGDDQVWVTVDRKIERKRQVRCPGCGKEAGKLDDSQWVCEDCGIRFTIKRFDL